MKTPLKIITLLVFAALVLAPSADAGRKNAAKLKTAEAVAAATKIITGPSGDIEGLQAPRYPINVKNSIDYHTMIFQSKQMDGVVYFGLSFNLNFLEGAYINEAYDSDGNEFPLQILKRKEKNVFMVNEIVVVNFSRGYLEAHVQNGIQLILVGEYEPRIVFVPGYYIEGLLIATDRVFPALKKSMETKVE